VNVSGEHREGSLCNHTSIEEYIQEAAQSFVQRFAKTQGNRLERRLERGRKLTLFDSTVLRKKRTML